MLTMSTPRYPVKGEFVHVSMCDGVTLSVHVHRPDKQGEFPAILQSTPYRKGRMGGHHPIVEHDRKHGRYGTIRLRA
jgi:predicted acyl esterase